MIFPGSSLVKALREKASEEKMTLDELARHLQISKPYLVAIYGGKRSVPGMDISYIRRIAQFLGITTVQAMIMGETLVPEDFVQSFVQEGGLDAALLRISRDKSLAGIAPTEDEWVKMPKKVRILLAALYERAIREQLLNLVEVSSYKDPQDLDPNQKSEG